MTNNIGTGALFIKDKAAMPESLAMTTEQYAAGWSKVIGCTAAQLGKEIENAGWTFFYMAGDIRKYGFGFEDRTRTDRAVSHLIGEVERQHCNCLEITEMRRRSILGIPYTSVVAHARHIQRSRNFHDSANLPTTHFFAGEAVQAWENEGGSGVPLRSPAQQVAAAESEKLMEVSHAK